MSSLKSPAYWQQPAHPHPPHSALSPCHLYPLLAMSSDTADANARSSTVPAVAPDASSAPAHHQPHDGAQSGCATVYNMRDASSIELQINLRQLHEVRIPSVLYCTSLMIIRPYAALSPKWKPPFCALVRNATK